MHLTHKILGWKILGVFVFCFLVLFFVVVFGVVLVGWLVCSFVLRWGFFGSFLKVFWFFFKGFFLRFLPHHRRD